VSAQSMTFGEMEHLSGMGMDFYWGILDGSVGLGLPFKGQQGSSLIQLLKQQGVIDSAVFSFDLDTAGSKTQGGEDSSGRLVLGGVDPLLYTGPLQTVEINDSGKWEVPAHAVFFNGINILKQSTVPVLVDSGVPTIGGPAPYIKQIMRELGARTWFGKTVVPCDIKFELTFLVKDGEPPLRLVARDLTQRLIFGQCLLLLTPLYLRQPNEHMWILGDALIRKYYTVFDMDSRTISFGLSNKFSRAGTMVTNDNEDLQMLVA